MELSNGGSELSGGNPGGASGGQSAPAPSSSSAPQSVEPSRPIEGGVGKMGQESGEGMSETQRAIRKLKASGKELEVSEDEFERYASMGYDAHNKWQEAARIREQNQLFLKTLRENPRSILENPKLGLDIKKIARDILYEEIEGEMMSPEERRIKELERELNGFRETEAEKSQREAQERLEADDRVYKESQDKAIKETLQGSKVPVTMFTYNSMVHYLSEALRAGYENVGPADVMPYVMRDYKASQEAIFSLPSNEMLSMLGEGNIEKIQRAVIERQRGRPAGNQARPEAKPVEDIAAKPGEKGMSLEEWREDIRRKMMQGRAN